MYRGTGMGKAAACPDVCGVTRKLGNNEMASWGKDGMSLSLEIQGTFGLSMASVVNLHFIDP